MTFVESRNLDMLGRLPAEWSKERIDVAIEELTEYLCGQPLDLHGLKCELFMRQMSNVEIWDSIARLAEFPMAQVLIETFIELDLNSGD